MIEWSLQVNRCDLDRFSVILGVKRHSSQPHTPYWVRLEPRLFWDQGQRGYFADVTSKMWEFPDMEAAKEHYDGLVDRLTETLIVPISDPVVARAQQHFPLLNEKRTVVPLADIPVEQRLLYRLKYG